MILNVIMVAGFSLIAIGSQKSEAIQWLAYAVVGIMTVGGLGLFLSTCIGMVRFPDFFTRLHAAGKGDTLSTILFLVGLSLYVMVSGDGVSKTTVLSALKITLIIHFVFLGSPTASSALVDAADRTDMIPWKNQDEAS